MTAFTWLAAAAAERDAAGLTRARRPRAADEPMLDLAGNDYLGLARHFTVTAAAATAVEDWGAGSTGSRLVTGSTALHATLERELAEFLGAESALVFSSGYLANLGAVSALAGRGDLVVSDAHAHASLVDACRLSRARVAVTPHGDPAAVGRALSEREEARALVLTDSVFSVDGDLGPVQPLHDVARQYGAALLVDEAHALGVVGPGGRGLVAAAGLEAEPDVVRTVTLSKALGAQGGAVLGSASVIEHLVNVARPFIYDTGLAPTSAAAALAALRILAGNPALADRCADRARGLAAIARQHGFRVAGPQAGVVALHIGAPADAVALGESLRRHGIRVGVFRPPSVPDDVARVRLTARADLTDSDLELFDKCLSAVKCRMSILVVTGTGTEVGKTIACAALAALSLDRDMPVAYVKVAQTGVQPGEPGDIETVCKLAGLDRSATFLGGSYPDALSPAAAARVRNLPPPSLDSISALVWTLASDYQLVIVEGAGGLLVRFDEDGRTLADLAHGLGVPVLVVAPSGLGTLNHTALTLEAMAHRGIELAGVVIGSWPSRPQLVERSNVGDLEMLAARPLAGALPARAGKMTPASFRTAARAALEPALGGTFDAARFRTTHNVGQLRGGTR